jgi:hypothetical protein
VRKVRAERFNGFYGRPRMFAERLCCMPGRDAPSPRSSGEVTDGETTEHTHGHEHNDSFTFLTQCY